MAVSDVNIIQPPLLLSIVKRLISQVCRFTWDTSLSDALHAPTMDEKNYRDLIVWLEDQKIRHYKIEDRGALKGIEEKDWSTAFKRYLGSLNCPINPNEHAAVLDWLLCLAVRFEYSDNGPVPRVKMKGERRPSSTEEGYHKRDVFRNEEQRRRSARRHGHCFSAKFEETGSSRILGCRPLSARGNDFTIAASQSAILGEIYPSYSYVKLTLEINGVNKLAGQLGVTQHPDHLVTLKGISKLITSRLSAEAMQSPGEVIHQVSSPH
ncbi:RNA transcription, translation and transport factor protein [Chionoecetes opilio]|uniref:RNA transcription, translation and transport factor protein n=1 Tax=Chionoecetes opilio TaxID=41210 RepID=A0A8J5D3F6_CHIOP|nr:RNA transcription, translation and transport factor protein [Chionoecetes opilio]